MPTHHRRAGVALVLILALALVPTAPAAAQPFDGDPSTVQRIEAGTPTAAAVAVSQMRFPDEGSAAGAVLATTADFADAMTGASLTGDAPLLLTGRDALDPQVAQELARAVAAGATVSILGGEGALSAEVAADVADLGFAVRRLAGATRFETAEAIARARAAQGPPVTEVLLARGTAPEGNPTAAWADAIAGSAAQLRPILLTGSDSLHPAARRIVTETGVPVILLGGEAALSAAVQSDVAGTGVATDRVQGSTRDGTAAAIAQRFFGVTADTSDRRAVMFTGFEPDGWAYGLAVAALAREQDAPLLPVNIGALATATATVVGCGSAPADVLVIGSTAVVPQATVEAHRGCPAPAPQQLVLDGDGVLPVAPFGGAVEPTVAAVRDVLGPPTEDTGWVEGCPFDGEGDNERFVSFGALTLAFTNVGGSEELTSWSQREGAPDLATERGITATSTNRDVAQTYPGATYSDEVFGPMWEVDPAEGGPMFFFPPDGEPDSVIDIMFGGTGLFCE